MTGDADRAERIDEAISRVRGRAQSNGGAVSIEVDAYKMITSIRIAPHAMSADPDNLARVVAALHRKASEEVEAAAQRVFEQLTAPRPTVRPTAAEWDDDRPTPITYSV
ncbi:YbaB/EbfC family nucleoid-associated protein [Nocardia otitidiscaviarum]|uniref:YbaB/EbfC family nucleoid-associated protein n=1 Tax=Nocardia otitidiscaviarum TaxID=1823 RepID=UPI001894E5A5|nr:YbaB/EbfC family nucleoid-associated protein [Nocardia otitidiscaviarum]MBF6179583.1 YbaB/EbfC family nucleoid-associated protein [Nocardia otitidiscaviarum]